MQRARAMEGGRSEDELRHGLPTWPAHRDTLRAARGPHGDLQRHQLRAHDPAQPARAASAWSRAPAPTPSTTTPARASSSTAPARASRARAGARRPTAGRPAEAAEARQEEAAAPRPVRPRPTTTSAAAAATRDTTAAATAAGARAERGQRAGASGSRPAARAAGVLPVHAVAADEVGGDAEAARVLLGGVPVQLPDAGAAGHLQPRHRRQQAHHHLQRGEPQRLRHRLMIGCPSECGRRRGPNEVPAPYFHRPLPDCTGEESGSLLDVLLGVVQIKKRVWHWHA